MTKGMASFVIVAHDSNGEHLTGQRYYRLEFNERDYRDYARDVPPPYFVGLPPANAFWSVTLYESRAGDFVMNAIGRFHLNSRTDFPHLYENDGVENIYNSDHRQGSGGEEIWPGRSPSSRSATILIQPDPPEDLALLDYWLPSPSEEKDIFLVLRMYLPTQDSMFYVPPPVESIS